MAERIDNLTPARVGRPPLYPWDEWMDGAVWRIQRGVDFTVAPRSMGSAIRGQADRSRRDVVIRIFDDFVEFQFIEPDEVAA